MPELWEVLSVIFDGFVPFARGSSLPVKKTGVCKKTLRLWKFGWRQEECFRANKPFLGVFSVFFIKEAGLGGYLRTLAYILLILRIV